MAPAGRIPPRTGPRPSRRPPDRRRARVAGSSVPPRGGSAPPPWPPARPAGPVRTAGCPAARAGGRPARPARPPAGRPGGRDRRAPHGAATRRLAAGHPGTISVLDWLGWWTYLMIVGGPGFRPGP